MAAVDQLNNLTGLMEAINGKKQTTKTKQTTQTKVSDAGVGELINQILSGPGGVRSIGTAARNSGLYNSTTEDTALGELYSNAAVKAELARSPTVSTTEQTVSTPGTGVGGLVGSIAASQAMKMLSGEENLISQGIDAVSGFFGGNAAASAGAATTSATSAALSGAGQAGAAQAMGALAPSAAMTAAGTQAANATVASMGSQAASAGATQAATTGATGAAAGSAAGQAGASGAAGGAAASGASAAAGFGMNAATAIPLAGSFLSGFLGGKDAATEPASLAMSAAMGAMALGPIGLIAAPIAAIAGGFLKDSVLCTALEKIGEMDPVFHAKGEAYIAKLPEEVVLGYQWLARPWVREIEAGNKRVIKFCKNMATAYIEYAYSQSVRKSPVGAFWAFFGEPICYVIGAVRKSRGAVKVSAAL